MQNRNQAAAARVRAIVFDDDQLVLDVLKRALMIRGYEVFAYSDPSEFPGCKYCGADPIKMLCTNILITDVNMPVVDGLTFIGGLREKNCPIAHTAAISGLWSGESREQAVRLGCQVFDKPLDFVRLNRWLDECESSMSSGAALMPAELLDTGGQGARKTG